MIPLFQVAMDPSAVSQAVATLLSGYVGQGPQVDTFEAAFGAAVEAATPPVMTSSGTAAMSLALALLGIGPGDEVISTPMTCVATNAPILRSGATIRWADVLPDTGLIDPDDVRRQMTSRTKAIVAVDYAGRACDYARLRQYGVPVIEDAAHAFLARTGGQPIAQAGGHFVVWSFQAIKHLTTIDGGALLAPADVLGRARLLRWYGLDRRSAVSFRAGQDITEIGDKWHMHDVAASIGLGNLAGACERVAQCRQHARLYHELLAGIPGLDVPPPDSDAAWWLYVVRVDQRDAFIQALAVRGVEAGPAHARNDTQTAFRAYRRKLPGVDAFAARQVAIPVGWWVTTHDVEHIAHTVRSWHMAQRRSVQASEDSTA